ncbi:MAG: hypothetical protein H6729_15570 [Deltaproteobacteria bacterium]|nr:hypothetical protein [Deltaproteobacteria bacterium]
MTSVQTRDAFVARHRDSAISALKLKEALTNVDVEAADAVGELGTRKSDAIEGEQAAGALFDVIDRFDTDGRRSTITSDTLGRTTRSGRILRVTESQYGKDFGDRLMEAGRTSIQRFEAEQDRCMNALGIGLLYGDTSAFGRRTERQKRAYIEQKLRDAGLPNSFYPWRQTDDQNISGPAVTRPYGPDNTACVDWVLRHVGNAYKMVAAEYRAEGQVERADALLGRWMEIFSIVKRHDVQGEYLCAELQKDGWEAIFWADDLTRDTGSERARANYAAATAGRAYEGVIYPDDTIVNFRAPGTAHDASGLEKLAQVPFWMGIAHGAYHVFCGLGATINESHQGPEIDERRAVENRTFDDFRYHEGVIMVPPGAWPRTSHPTS